MSALPEFIHFEQGSAEWLALRKTKISATDAPVIMGDSPWKTIHQLYEEKISEENNNFKTERMQRGIDLEPVARELFIIETGIEMTPAVIVKDWAMASLDGLSSCGRYILEVKCPGDADHAIAIAGSVPMKYYAQLQHQMNVADVDLAYYYSFDGFSGIAVVVHRDNDYIEKMVEKEKAFYECLINRTPPEGNRIKEMTDVTWSLTADEYINVDRQLKELEAKKEHLRKQLIFLSGEESAKGEGITLTKYKTKGSVDYSKIPELNKVDLELYRKEGVEAWKITVQKS